MELSFNVAWGPISQIAIPLLDVNAAIQIAVGAYGWWKARERSLSLMETIEATSGHLAPSTNFNKFRYEAARRTTEVRGIAWYDGRLESFPCPRASTANIGDGGLICLRAITTALLAIYDVNATTAVLARIIPQSLINYDLGDQPSGGRWSGFVINTTIRCCCFNRRAIKYSTERPLAQSR